VTVVTFWETITASRVCRYSFVAISGMNSLL